MSWTSFSQQIVNPENLMVAEQQVDVYMEIVSQCRSKCIPPHYREPDLHKGEMVCIDECVVKYMKFQRVLGLKLQEKYPEQFPASYSNTDNNNNNTNNSYESTF
ncbi:unnamed protein product [Cunninghamella echinulata]